MSSGATAQMSWSPYAWSLHEHPSRPCVSALTLTTATPYSTFMAAGNAEGKPCTPVREYTSIFQQSVFAK